MSHCPPTPLLPPPPLKQECHTVTLPPPPPLQAIAPVKRVSVSHANGLHSLEPVVAGVVKQLELRVQEDGQLVQ